MDALTHPNAPIRVSCISDSENMYRYLYLGYSALVKLALLYFWTCLWTVVAGFYMLRADFVFVRLF